MFYLLINYFFMKEHTIVMQRIYLTDEAHVAIFQVRWEEAWASLELWECKGQAECKNIYSGVLVNV